MNIKQTSKQDANMELTIEPNHELLAWEKWIQIRREEAKTLALMTGRPPVDFIMNLQEKIREDKERKTVLEHAQIEPKASLRGGLWEQPLRLKQPCSCNPVYEVKRTHAEMGKPRVIEYVGVPKYIQETEKGLSGVPQRQSHHRLDAEYTQYRDKRERELSKNIINIDPFRPDIDKLLVRGTKPKPPKKKLTYVPAITVEDYSVPSEISTVYAVRINNTVIYKVIPDQTLILLDSMKKERWHENYTSWTYYFKVPIKKAGISRLYLENLGTVTLRYCWRKLKKNIPFISEETYNQVFFFNKNEDVISPGQSKILHFTFISDMPGIFGECWELSFCNIFFYDTLTDKLVINLSGDSIEDIERITREVNALKGRIGKKVITNIVKHLLDDILNKVFTIEPYVYPYKDLLLESEMFMMKNPACFYHQTEVMKMKDLYSEMTNNDQWDLSIGTWRQKMMEKGYDERMKYYELLRDSYSELLKPWYEGEKVLEQKYRAMKWFLGELADKIDFEYERALKIYGFIQESVKPRVSTSRNNSIVELDTNKRCFIRNLLYLHTYEHVATTIEACAGVLSSIDLNRWIQFDFCQI